MTSTNSTIEGYPTWLQETWMGDARELSKGRYLHQQRDLERAFDTSPFLKDLRGKLATWAHRYRDDKGVDLFSGSIPSIDLDLKPWDSFLSKTWRHNVARNTNWPTPPDDGWLLPDCWFEGMWDIVRTRLVARYLDGVERLADELEELAHEHGLSVRRVTHAQEWGYYAVHIVISQSFRVQTLNYEDEEERSSEVEVQLTTELQEAIGSLTHGYFEHRREGPPENDIQKWQWDYASSEFTAYYLGHLLHYLEGMIMRLRNESAPGDAS